MLVTRGLLPWIKHGDVQPTLKGSDHCPVYVDLHDELTSETGETIKLSDAMQQKDDMQPPRIAAKYWEELAGKQTMLSNFFGKRGAQPSPTAEASPPNDTPATPVPSSSLSQASATSSASTDPAELPAATQSQVKSPPKTTITSRLAPAASTTKRKPTEKASCSTSNKKRKRDPAQSNISTFFGKPPAAASKALSKEVIVLDDDEPEPSRTPCTAEEDQIDADARLARELSMSEASAVANEPSSSQSKTAWAGLFAPLAAPHCTVHDEPAKLWTVNKPGPNKGKKFYLCSRYACTCVAFNGVADRVRQAGWPGVRQGQGRAAARGGQPRVSLQLLQVGERCEEGGSRAAEAQGERELKSTLDTWLYHTCTRIYILYQYISNLEHGTRWSCAGTSGFIVRGGSRG